MRSFIDTNVLVCADAADAKDKRQRAAELIVEHLRSGAGVVSTQVLHEFVSAAVRKLALPLEIVRARIHLYCRFEVVNATPAAVQEALDLHALHGLSYWDALIVQAARQSGCARLLTEHLHAGATIAGVRIVNPFDAVPKARPAPRKR